MGGCTRVPVTLHRLLVGPALLVGRAFMLGTWRNVLMSVPTRPAPDVGVGTSGVVEDAGEARSGGALSPGGGGGGTRGESGGGRVTASAGSQGQ